MPHPKYIVASVEDLNWTIDGTNVSFSIQDEEFSDRKYYTKLVVLGGSPNDGEMMMMMISVVLLTGRL